MTSISPPCAAVAPHRKAEELLFPPAQRQLELARTVLQAPHRSACLATPRGKLERQVPLEWPPACDGRAGTGGPARPGSARRRRSQEKRRPDRTTTQWIGAIPRLPA